MRRLKFYNRLIFIFRIRTKEKDAGKGERTAQTPNGVGTVFEAGRDAFQNIGAEGKGGIQTATVFPAFAAVVVNDLAEAVHCETRRVAGMLIGDFK